MESNTQLFEAGVAVKKLTVANYRSSGKWQAIKNSSWGEIHTKDFGNKSGYVICHKNNNTELVALAAVIGMPYASQKEIDANAILIANAPTLLNIVQQLAKLEATDYITLSTLVTDAKNVMEDLIIDKK